MKSDSAFRRICFLLDQIYLHERDNFVPCAYLAQKGNLNSTLVFHLFQKHMGLIISHSGHNTQGYFKQNFNSLDFKGSTAPKSLETASPDSRRGGNTFFFFNARLAPGFG